jgi:VanZ family protein
MCRVTTPLDNSSRHAARLRRVGWLAGFAWLLLVAILSLLPGGDQPAPFPHADKLVHFCLYGFSGAWFAMLGREHRLLIVLLLAAYGAGLEVAQEFVSRRGFDWLDILANTAGAIAGTIIIRYLWNPLSWLQPQPEKP